MTRDIAERFNRLYGDTFVLPEPRIEESVSVVPGIDGQKMSKSYGNTIDIFSEENIMRKRIMSIVTDATPVEAPKDPEKCNVFKLYKLFASPEEVAELDRMYRQGGTGYAVSKQMLFEKVKAYFKPYREKRIELEKERKYVEDVMARGAEKARYHASRTLQKVRRKTGLIYKKY